jgi:hypothetical protein
MSGQGLRSLNIKGRGQEDNKYPLKAESNFFAHLQNPSQWFLIAFTAEARVSLVPMLPLFTMSYLIF